MGKVLFWMAIAFLLLAFLWFVPQLHGQYYSQGVPSKDVPELVNEYRRTWAQILGGAVLLLGLYFTWRGQRLTQQSLEDTRRNTEENLRLTREGQITDRFTRAIDQLGKTDDRGNKLFEIRLGGIYALERIARESVADRWPIMEILISYVRQYAAPRSMEEPGDESSVEVHPPDPDVQAILDILLKDERFDGELASEPLDLHALDLSGVDLQGANLRNANLRGVNLRRANLRNANLQEADLREASLQDAHLDEANLARAHLEKANVSRAVLSRARLEGAYLGRVHLEYAFLGKALLEGAHLWAAHLEGARLEQADLRNANLEGAHLAEANLWGANLEGTRVGKADLRNTEGRNQQDLDQTVGDRNTTQLLENRRVPKSWV